MLPKMSYIKSLIITFFLVSLFHGVKAKRCPYGQYRKQVDLAKPEVQCVPCTTCPINHIIRVPCMKSADTVCSPFYEFEYFNQPLHQQQQLTDEVPTEIWRHQHRMLAKEKRRRKLMNSRWQGRSVDGNSADVEDMKVPGLKEGGVKSDLDTLTDNSNQKADAENEWRLISYILIVLLTVIVISNFLYCSIKFYLHGREKTFSPEELRGITAVVGPDGTSIPVIAVDRNVRHIEAQVNRNQRHRAFLRYIFGDTSQRAVELGRNEYVDVRTTPLNRPSVGLSSLEQTQRTFPGMVSLSPRRFASRSFNRQREALEGFRRLLDPTTEGNEEGAPPEESASGCSNADMEFIFPDSPDGALQSSHSPDVSGVTEDHQVIDSIAPHIGATFQRSLSSQSHASNGFQISGLPPDSPVEDVMENIFSDQSKDPNSCGNITIGSSDA